MFIRTLPHRLESQGQRPRHVVATSTDELGRERAGIFYKAAFYDRSAHMHRSTAATSPACRYDEGPVIFDGQWAT